MANDPNTTNTTNTTITPSQWHTRQDDEGGPMPLTPPADLGQDWRPRQNGLD